MTARLRELLGKATKGPLYIYRQPNVINITTAPYPKQGDRRVVIARIVNIISPEPLDEQDEANAALIVEAVNSLPALLNALDEARGALETATVTINTGGKVTRETEVYKMLKEALSKINEVMK